MLSASDRAICASISETDTDSKEIQKLYWEYGARASLNIDASKLENSTYERMHPYLSEMEAAEDELRQGVKQMCLFDYYVARRKVLEKSALIDVLGSSWLGPAKEKYNAALKATEEAYERISLEEGLIHNVDPQ